MEALKGPRLLLLVWGGVGVLALLYFIIAASVQPDDGRGPSARNHDSSLIVGEMADFQYTFPPRGAPQTSFQYDGKEMTIADFRGKTILVNFWATWCLPCVKELPSLDALEGKLGGRTFEVVAIAADASGPEKVSAFLDRHQIKNLKLYADPTLTMAFSVGAENVLPMSILYDEKGVEIGRLIGEADWASPEAIRLVESAIP